jgi:hypothetical protein
VRIPALLLLAVGLALADASVVTLALPPIIDELNASVQGAAAVLGCYTLVLAVALPLAARLRTGPRAVAAGGGALFAAASLGCGLSGGLAALLVWRCLQAAGAAAVLVAAFTLLDAGHTGRRAWNAAAIFGFAAGPALGGALTQALDWRAIFLVQAPVAAAAGVAAWRAPAPTAPLDEREPWPLGPAVALALASIPTASLWWTVPPQVMAGVGMGMALPALAGDLLPERTAGQAARLLSARHAGITVALVLLAPVVATRIDDTVATGREQGTALVLDAKLPPLDKLSLARALVGDLDPVDPRGQLQASLRRARGDIGGDDLAAYETLAERADDALVTGVQHAFAPAFAICGVLALIGALALLPWSARVVVAGLAALALAGGAWLIRPALAPEPVTIANPCRPRTLPHTGGIDGALQDVALGALDRAACRYGSSREELALALVDTDARTAFERKYGVDPRKIGGLLQAILGL